MKNLFLITVLFLSIQSFAQKTITIYNLSSTNFDIGEINTKNGTTPTPPTTVTYPVFKSNYGTAPNNIIHIPAGTTYILQCSPASITRFPFLSPSSVPQITSWRRKLTAAGTWTAVTSAATSSAYGNTQVFDFMKTQVGPNGTLGGGNLRPNYTTPLYVDWTFYNWNSVNGIGAGTVSIDQDPVGTPGGTQEVTVIITD